MHRVLHEGFQRRGGLFGASRAGTIPLPHTGAARATAVVAEQVKIGVLFVLVRSPSRKYAFLSLLRASLELL